jgi:hypothetical protein
MDDAAELHRRDMVELSAALRGMSAGASCMEETARRLVRHLYDNVRDGRTGQRLPVLARLFKTHPFGQLPPSLQEFARGAAGGHVLSDETSCLTLLASHGDLPAWNSRHTSVGHQAIPLTSAEMVRQSPMIGQLLEQFGIDPQTVIAPQSNILLNPEKTAYNIFHVEHAVGSPYVPAQSEFVERYGIASVLGFGGPLIGGNLFAIILFTRKRLTAEAAALFPSIALSAELALLSFAGNQIFVPEEARTAEFSVDPENREL